MTRANSIVSIGVNASAVRTHLGNGNMQTAAGTFTPDESHRAIVVVKPAAVHKRALSPFFHEGCDMVCGNKLDFHDFPRVAKQILIVLGFLIIGNARAEDLFHQRLNFESEVECSSNRIKVASKCIGIDDAYSQCSSQSVSFISNDKIINNFEFRYKKDSQVFIRKVSCIKSNNKYYISLDSSNLGGCKNCEWSDLFDVNGRYHGSTAGRPDFTSFKRRILSNEGLFVLNNGIEVVGQNIFTVK